MFKIGADPELFLKDAAGGFISAIGKIGGTKHAPLPLPIGDGYAVQEDNVAIEYNIPPAESKEQLVNTINLVTTYLAARIARIGLQFTQESAVVFPQEQLLDPRALEFGCEPDFNAWREGKINGKPKAKEWKLRTCGGHIHVGYPFKTKRESVQFVKYMDLFLGVPAGKMDKGDTRKELYGSAGAFRYKPYGVEYRVLSNFWTFDDKYIEWVWDATTLAMDAWQNKTIDVDKERSAILSAINMNNKQVVDHLIEKHGLLVT